MNTLECIASRRSCRRYLPDAVPEEKLSAVIEAGRLAPSGGNNQSWHFLVVTNREVMDRLKVLVQDSFSKLEVEPGMYASLVSSINLSKAGNYVFHFNAPAFIIVANKRGYGNALADSACAMENMMLAAEELGLGSCWVNQLRWLDRESGMTGEHPELDAYLRSIGLEEDEFVCASLSLGFAASQPAGTLERKSKVTYIR